MNAAILAVEILAVEDEALAKKLLDARRKGAEKAAEKRPAVAEKFNNDN